jgi:hypothetical protein
MVTTADIGRFFAIEQETVDFALRELSPFIFRCNPPFLNSQGDECLSLHLPGRVDKAVGNPPSLLRESEQCFGLDPVVWLKNSVQYIRWYNTLIAGTCKPSGEDLPQILQ